jgi:hypothetical protein
MSGYAAAAVLTPRPCNGKGDAYRYCKRYRPGAIERKGTRELAAGRRARARVAATELVALCAHETKVDVRPASSVESGGLRERPI